MALVPHLANAYLSTSLNLNAIASEDLSDPLDLIKLTFYKFMYLPYLTF